jgi:uncharacterized protein YndB with AHSA1/START domain
MAVNMKKKHKYVAEYEIRASAKMIYPYLNTASGLSQWFAEDVNIKNDEKVYHFIWEGENHFAKLTAQRTNAHVKFEFLPENAVDEKDPSYIEFKIDTNELTQSVYLKIIDYSDMEDEEELKDLWDNLIDALKEIVGG